MTPRLRRWMPDSRQHQLKPNGNTHNGIGLVTPPSPRSISSDLSKHHRRKQSMTSWGGSRSHLAESNKDDGGRGSRQRARRCSMIGASWYPHACVPWPQDELDSDVHHASDDARILSSKHYPTTLESSVRKAWTGPTTRTTTEDDVAHASSAAAATDLKGAHFALVSFVLCVFMRSLTALCRERWACSCTGSLPWWCVSKKNRCGAFLTILFYVSVPALVWLSGDSIPPFSDLIFLVAVLPALSLCASHLLLSRIPLYLFVSE